MEHGSDEDDQGFRRATDDADAKAIVDYLTKNYGTRP